MINLPKYARFALVCHDIGHGAAVVVANGNNGTYTYRSDGPRTGIQTNKRLSRDAWRTGDIEIDLASKINECLGSRNKIM